ncbi:MAG TPA: PD-(D/E)XK nuclease family protein, partial [Bacteroidia bacterium]|nr:PD-(D/E)XK nuclease family protein [Bacteroidia bacterium]
GAERFNVHTREGELKYYHTDLSRLFRHPYIKQLLASSGLAEKIDMHLAKRNIIFSSPGQMQNFFPELKEEFAPIAKFLQPWKNVNAALDGISFMIELLRPVFTRNTKEDEAAPLNIDLEYLYQVNLIVKRARTLHEKWNLAVDIKSLKALIDQQLSSATLPFYGEPLAGLQIMGVLETRTLDFENVILLSANENIIPAGKVQHSFILYDLRKYFKMPVWDDKDAVSAYHFYRLLQRAKNIFIVHNTDQEVFGNREKSRFVTQLLYELPEVNKNVKIQEVVFDAGLPDTSIIPELISVPKTGAIPSKLDELIANGLSPSLLNSYRDCGLKFYFHYVAHLREPEEVEETIESNTLGKIIHKSLEELYRPVIGEILTADFFVAAKKKVTHTCEAMFAHYFTAEESSFGKNLLAKKIAIRYINSYLDSEKKNLSGRKGAIPQVAELEKNLEYKIDIAGKTVLLSGQADRIDKTDQQITLIDYKTGKAEQRELKIH